MKKRVYWAIGLVALSIASGTAGYMIIEGWNFLDSVFMTITTLTTVGYREVHELSIAGTIFTLILILFGVGTVLYALGVGAQLIIEGELQEIFGRKKLQKRINALKDHYIVCGYGRMGKIVCRELIEEQAPVVVIEKNRTVLGGDDSTLILTGDATNDESLKEAGIERAKGLISVLSTDAENLFVVLSARALNPELFIVARAGDEGAEKKLMMAGANKVVSPYHIGGLRIAHTVLRPAVVDFIEFATKTGNIELQMEEITIPEGSELAGKSLDQCGIGKKLGIIIVGIKRATGEMKFNPTFHTSINAGDTMIALGEIGKLKALEAMVKSKGS